MTPPFVLRPATRDDLDTLCALNERIAGAPVWTPSQWLTVLAGHDVRRATVLALRDSAACGFVVTAIYDDFAELESIAVLATEQSKGAGGALLSSSIKSARVAGVEQLQLEVAAENGAALRLYTTAGFVTVGSRPGYYGRGGGSERAALLMSLALRPLPEPRSL